MREISLSQKDIQALLDWLEKIRPIIDLDLFIRIDNLIKGVIKRNVITDVEIQEIIDLIKPTKKKNHKNETTEGYNVHKMDDESTPSPQIINENILMYQSELVRFRRYLQRLLLIRNNGMQFHKNKR